MKFYRDIDYYLYFEQFQWPMEKAAGYIEPMPDGTVCIHVNTLKSDARQLQTVKHELRHLAFNHPWNDIDSVDQIEAEANDEESGVAFGPAFAWVEGADRAERQGQLIILPVPPAAPKGMRLIPVYSSGEEFLAYYVTRAAPESLAVLRSAGWRG